MKNASGAKASGAIKSTATGFMDMDAEATESFESYGEQKTKRRRRNEKANTTNVPVKDCSPCRGGSENGASSRLWESRQVRCHVSNRERWEKKAADGLIAGLVRIKCNAGLQSLTTERGDCWGGTTGRKKQIIRNDR